MRGALHLVPLFEHLDDADSSNAVAHDTLHPIPVGPSADALQLDASATRRLATILASVPSDSVARNNDAHAVDLQKLQELPPWAQDIVRSGCFEGDLDKSTVFQRRRSLRQSAASNSALKRTQIDGPTRQATKRARSVVHDSKDDASTHKTKEHECNGANDNNHEGETHTTPLEYDECPLRTLFTRSELVAGTTERYSEQLSQLLDQLHDRQQTEAFERNDSELLTSAEVKALFQTLKIMHKRDMMAKVDSELLLALMTVLNQQVLRGIGLDVLGAMSLGNSDAASNAPAINVHLIARMQRCMDVSVCALLVLSTHAIDRRVVSEETIDNCIELFNHVLQRLVIPCIDTTAAAVAATEAKAAKAATQATKTTAKLRKSSMDENDSDSHSPQTTARPLRQRRSAATTTVRANRAIREAITPLVHGACEFLQQLSCLLVTVKLADRWILLFSSSLVELFLLEHSTHAAALQESAKAVLRGIFLQYDVHRPLILDEIVTVMKKLSTSKRHLRTVKLLDGSDSVQMITTLVIAMVQASASIQHVELERARNNGAADSTSHAVKDGSAAEIQHFRQSLDDARDSASTFIRALVQSCLKKHEERDYRVVLDNFVEDLLVLFVRPDTTGAEVLLEVLSASLASILHANLTKDAKKLELQHVLTALNLVGKICTAIKRHENAAARDLLCDDVDATAVLDDHAHFLHEHMKDATRKSKDHKSTQQQHDWRSNKNSVVLKHALIVSMRNNSTRASTAHDDSMRLLLARFIAAVCPSLKRQSECVDCAELALWRSFWKNSAQSIISSSKLLSPSSALAQRLSRQLVVARDFCSVFDKLLTLVMSLLSRGAPTFRARVLKVLATVVDVDPKLMGDSSIRAAVHRCFTDDATSVRQAAVDLVGRHVSLQPVLFERYFDMLAERLRDRGISVRKSVCKIFRAFLISSSSEHHEHNSTLSESDLRRKSACMRSLVERIGDPSEERVVKNFIIDTFQDVWFGAELTSQRLSTIAGDFIDDTNGDELPPGWKTVDVNTASDRSAQPPASNTVEFIAPDGRVFQSRKDAWAAYRAPQITPSSVVQSKRAKADDTPDLVATIVEVIYDMPNLDWFVALLRRLLFHDARNDVARSGAVRATKDRADDVAIATKRSEKIVEHLVECLLQLDEGTRMTGVTIADEHAQLLACMKALSVFCEAQPLLLYPRLELILVHLKGDDNLPKAVESRVQSLVLAMATHVFAHMKRIPERLVRRLETDVKSLVFRAPPSVVGPSIQYLATVSQTTRKAPALLFTLVDTFYAYLLKYKDVESLASISPDVSSSLQRALFAAGQIGGVIDLDACKLPSTVSITSLPHGAIMQTLFATFARFVRLPGDATCAAKAAQGLGFLFLTRTRLLLQAQQDGILSFLLSESADELKLQCLSSLNELLRFEERRLERGVAAQHMNASKSAKEQVQGDQEADAALIGSVMQAQIQNVLALALDASVRMRSEAVTCIDILLVQGLVSPLHCIPVLVALATDQVVSNRNVAHSQLVALHESFPSLLNTAVAQGIQVSHAFQIRAFGSSAVLTLDKDEREYSLFGRLYSTCIRGTRKHRNLFLKALVNQFADSGSVLAPLLTAATGSGATATTQPIVIADVHSAVAYLSYVAQLLCALPFEVDDEPLLVIYWINRYATLKLSSVLDRIKDRFAAAGFAPDVMADDETDFTDVDVADYLPTVTLASDDDAAKLLQHECLVGFAIALLLHVKSFLKDRFHLESEKCMTYQPANAIKATDEPLVVSDRVPRLNLPQAFAQAMQTDNHIEASWNLFVCTWEVARDDQRQMDAEVHEVAKPRKRKGRTRKSVAAKRAADDNDDDDDGMNGIDMDDDEFVEGFAD